MNTTINLQGMLPSKHSALPITIPGYDENPSHEQISFNDYYMEMDGKPFYGVCGEFHYSRVAESRWDEELAKMAMNGVNIISTYVFWNHHEESEGHWNFSGNKDLRKFIRLCAKNHLFVIVRLGPFDHGEVRNGGLPDWLFGKPYEVRSLDPGFLNQVGDLYAHEAEQLEDLYYSDGGPIIAAQLDNEYMHSSAPWEITTGISNEWVSGGHDGKAYLQELKKIAIDAGIRAPFFTCTGWGGSPVPADMLPLCGGYAYRPWLFYSHEGEHPLTDEYLYRNYHSNECPRSEDFSPSYDPTSVPYACCEMGGGMFSSYNYRFVLPMKSVDAMANIKLGSGCNMLGYYMFHGGTNPIGEGVYLNESQTPKRSYDFQAALGEFGQVRESYKRLKTIHYFVRDFATDITPLEVCLPVGQESLAVNDMDSLRWSVRSDGKRGFVFLNNFQDHGRMQRQDNRSITVILSNGEHLYFDDIGLENEENCILPFNMNLSGITLVTATVQPVARIQTRNKDYPTYIFMRPDGMRHPSMIFDNSAVMSEEIDPKADEQVFTVSSSSKTIEILLVSREKSNNMYLINHESVIFTESNASVSVAGSHQAFVESRQANPRIESWPQGTFVPKPVNVKLNLPTVGVQKVSEMKYVLKIPNELIDSIGHSGIKDILLQIRYTGDIGWLWAGDILVNDNFANGATWEIGLRDYKDLIGKNNNVLVLGLTPLKEAAVVNVDSAMAARSEQVGRETGYLESVFVQPIYVQQIQTKLKE